MSITDLIPVQEALERARQAHHTNLAEERNKLLETNENRVLELVIARLIDQALRAGCLDGVCAGHGITETVQNRGWT